MKVLNNVQLFFTQEKLDLDKELNMIQLLNGLKILLEESILGIEDLISLVQEKEL
eukprot:CAMPEP_0205828836 /NCGR_PEP_ID=MMETSP0206-20130828/36273_1 /ASSEMBLY_ACC=CAM_ASM_000279 /TAXON_ID=36767 /ORGANISM="Euplotes focardii, Strain TN1" /LENGTH=54 /DNA_ID=CAMNT_0053131015 /DNA_START=330 /DNA_END=490 /DNA_ORIENTATION=-